MPWRNQPHAKHNPFGSAPLVHSVGFTIGAQVGSAINIALQLKDANGRDIASRAAVRAYLSSDAAGDVLLATAPTTVAIGTDGLLIDLITGKSFMLTSEADGDIDITITEEEETTCYFVVVLPDGRRQVSDVITLASTTTTSTTTTTTTTTE